MRKLLLVPAFLLLTPALSPAQETGFEIEITGSVEATLADTDALARRGRHPSGEGTELRVDLDDDTKDNCSVVLQINVGEAARGDEEGTYELRGLLAGIEASRTTIICGELEIMAAQANEGTLTITSSNEDGVSGELDYEGETMLLGSGEPTPIQVKGSFTAEWSDL